WLHDGLEMYNGYGPTEASIGSVFMKLDVTTQLPPPIGRPKPNYQAYVLDPHLNPVPVGVVGELHIGGAGVARGYLHPPHLSTAALRQHLAARLPAAMVPTHLITLDELPLTTNGKIDRAALPAPETVTASAERVPPRTLIETVLVDLYATVLGNEQVGAGDSF